MTAQRTYPAGVTSWIDLEVGDVDAAQEFYGGLFGWSFEQVTPPEAPARYLIARLDGQDAAGLAESAEGSAGWNTYVAVDDADAACASWSRRGTVVSPPADAGEGGRAAAIADPAGVELALWQARRRPGVQVSNTPGGWNFSDLHAADPAASQAFYEQVFGWVFVDMGFATMIQVPGYGDHLAATVDPGIHERQASAPPGFADVIGGLAPADELGPRWHVTFTVADRDATVADAERLGASVLSQGVDDWTRSAVLRDPQGAVFTASQFTPGDDW